jgi:hypothetical protein
MKKSLLFVFFCALTGLNAQVVTQIPTITLNGFTFDVLHPSGSLDGTLTSVQIQATLSASVLETYADDLTIYITPTSTIGPDGLLQVGGFSNTGAIQRYDWPNGASDVPGTTVSGTVTLTTPINFTGETYQVWLGNGYGGEGTQGTWTNITVTLNGVTQNTASVDDFFVNNLKLYPNPTKEVINLSSVTTQIENVKITDMSGRLINQINNVNQDFMTINTSYLNAGVYLITVETESGSGTSKFIKQ